MSEPLRRHDSLGTNPDEFDYEMYTAIYDSDCGPHIPKIRKKVCCSKPVPVKKQSFLEKVLSSKPLTISYVAMTLSLISLVVSLYTR